VGIGIAAHKFHREEPHALENSHQRSFWLIAPREDVGHVAQRFDMPYFQAGLFAHLAHRGVFGPFPLLDMTFRQRPGVGSFGANQHELKSAVVPAPVYEAARGYFAPDRQLGARALVVSVFAH